MKKTLLLITSILLFIEFLDTTILYSCVIPISKEFSINSTRMSLPMLTYIIGTCILIPITAWLANQYNRILILIISLSAFTLFSLLCGLAPELYLFSTFRFLQGVAISISSAIAIITLLSICSGKEIITTMGKINIPGLMGTAAGPFFGAIISHYLSWRFAFFINLPICSFIILKLIPLKSKPIFNTYRYEIKHLDYLGFGLLCFALILLSTGLEQLSHSLHKTSLAITLLSLPLFAAYVIIWNMRELSSFKKTSILDLKIFRNLDFQLGIFVNIIARSAMCGLPILLSIVLQQAYHFTIIKAGVCLAIVSLAGIVAKIFSSAIIQLGIDKSIILFSTFTSLSIRILSNLNTLINYHLLCMACFTLGLFMSFLYTTINSILYVSIDKEDVPAASNIGKIIQQFSIGLGVIIAINGFQFFCSYSSETFSLNKNIIINSYSHICNILAFIMLFNLPILLFFTKRKKHFALNN